jgi:hypothetical protein
MSLKNLAGKNDKITNFKKGRAEVNPSYTSAPLIRQIPPNPTKVVK